MDRPSPRLRLGLILVAVACAVAALLAACSTASGDPAAGDDDRLAVVASTTVFADLVAQVGGDRVSVVALVPKGGEVHTFDPTPSDLRAVAEADLVVMNGLGLDEWVRDVVADSGTSAVIVELAEDLPGVAYIQEEDHDAEPGQEPSDAADEHGHGGVNPHLWLDVAYAGRYVERIVDALATADPDQEEAFRAAGATYLDTLEELDRWARETLQAVPAEDRRIVSFHEALPYLARAYGLTIVGTIVDAPGQDPSAGEIAALVDEVRASGASAVFGEVQFSPDLVETVASEAGVPVESDLYTDSLGDPPVDTYEGMMRWTIERIAGAIRR